MKGGLDKCQPKAVVPKGVWGHAPLENFSLILAPLKCDFQRFQGQFVVV